MLKLYDHRFSSNNYIYPSYLLDKTADNEKILEPDTLTKSARIMEVSGKKY